MTRTKKLDRLDPRALKAEWQGRRKPKRKAESAYFELFRTIVQDQVALRGAK